MIHEELSTIVGFNVPLHAALSKRFGRDVLDFSAFIDEYFNCYGRRGMPLLEDIEHRFGKKAIQLLDKLN